MNVFRFFRPVVSTASRTLARSPATAWHSPYRSSIRQSIFSYSTVGSRRAGPTSWHTHFHNAHSRTHHQQERTYRQQTFNRNNVNFFINLMRKWAARPTFYYEVSGLGGACGIYYIANLETVPVSGRRRFNVVSNANEKWLAQLTLEQILSEYKGRILPESSKEHRMAVRVMKRLIPHCGLEGQEWEVRVIADEQKNAFVLPGGKVFVFSGILDVCRDDDGLAAVLGHEIAHNVAHHAAEQASRSLILFPIGAVAFLALGLDPSLWRMFSSLAFTLPGSRRQEEEADYIGLLMMSEACYNPHAAMRLWAAMEKEEQGRAPPQYLSTHPSSRSRLEKIQEWLPQANDKREQGDCAVTVGYADSFRQAYDFRRRV